MHAQFVLRARAVKFQAGFASSLQHLTTSYNYISDIKWLSLARLLHHEVHFLDDTRPALERWVFKCALNF